MRVGIAADHGGFSLKENLRAQRGAARHEVIDFGAHSLDSADDYHAQALQGDIHERIAL